jgi:hypothetical protein
MEMINRMARSYPPSSSAVKHGRAIPVCLITFLLLALGGCSLFPRADDTPERRDHYYADAILEFAMEYPAHWPMVREPFDSTTTVAWEAPRERMGPEAPARAEVTSLAATTVDGLEELVNRIRNAHPDLLVTDTREVKKNSHPARQITGNTASRSFLIQLMVGQRRAFILEFSAPDKEFKEFQEIFEGMAKSFTILE